MYTYGYNICIYIYIYMYMRICVYIPSGQDLDEDRGETWARSRIEIVVEFKYCIRHGFPSDHPL